jgi:hypothetical protein
MAQHCNTESEAMGRREIELAKMNLAVANRLFDHTIDGAERILRARMELSTAMAASRSAELDATAVVTSALSEFADNLLAAGNGDSVILCGVRQEEAATFLASEAATDDGWTWPVRLMRSGWAAGTLETADGKLQTPHYFPTEIVAKVAEAANGSRFRRRHPAKDDGNDAPELTAGWLSHARISGTSALAMVNLLKSETEIRSKLMAAREAGKLVDLFGVSIMAYFGFRQSTVEGKSALVATSLQKFVGLDLCAEPGAGGRFLQTAAG